jgi:hypothetical protein
VLRGNHLTKSEMTGDNKTLNDRERAELLCFLVISQLIAHASTGEWLRTDHLVESTRGWLASNSARCEWLERAKLAQMSGTLALRFLLFAPFSDGTQILNLLTDGWRLDYRSPEVHRMLDVCAAHLLNS